MAVEAGECLRQAVLEKITNHRQSQWINVLFSQIYLNAYNI
jgi:hypothetical protein